MAIASSKGGCALSRGLWDSVSRGRGRSGGAPTRYLTLDISKGQCSESWVERQASVLLVRGGPGLKGALLRGGDDEGGRSGCSMLASYEVKFCSQTRRPTIFVLRCVCDERMDEKTGDRIGSMARGALVIREE